MLRAEGVAAFRGERLVLRDISFAVAAGGALLLTGPNGAGKSTLLRLLAGLGRAAAGRVLWGEQDALADPIGHARRVGYLGHLDALKLGLTAVENLRLWGRRPRIVAALETLALGHVADLPVRYLSAGQRRRTALARLLLTEAPLWLLDEPTLGLDAASVDRFGTMLAEHRGRGGMVLTATHVALPLPEAAELRLG
ncbi:MAG: heme ABC exporter ATP-binding protein CcmA [Acetobacteraceae bacterium]|nr:heme ABC exporter ATP-binding protein CcmA [Acetobacteraceae bacterium]